MSVDSEIPTTVDRLAGLPRPGQMVADKYEVTGVIGVGGMGVVLEAIHQQLREQVAIKALLPELGADQEAQRRFEREARAVVRIKSEHVARVLDVGRLRNGNPYMVMEYLEGSDLAELQQGSYALPVEEAVGHVLQACEAVAEAHSLGIVHRDLKPENLYLIQRPDGSSCIKVLDFGLSKVPAATEEEARPSRALTGHRQAMGTPNYMSPEQWMSARDVGPSSDQWALAAILYELLTGLPAFGGKEIGQVCAKILHKEPVVLRERRADVPAELERAVVQALSKDPARRFASLLEFAQAIAPFGSELAGVSVNRVAGVFERSGEYRIPPGSGDRQVVRPVVGDSPLDNAPTLPRLEAEVADQVRHQTAQSWQKMLGMEGPRRTWSVAVLAVAGGMVLVSFIVLIALMWARSGPPEPAGLSAEPTESAIPSVPDEPLDEQADSSAGELDDDAGAEPAVEATATASSDASAEPTAAPRSPRPRTPRPGKSSGEKKKGTIFDSRM